MPHSNTPVKTYISNLTYLIRRQSNHQISEQPTLRFENIPKLIVRFRLITLLDTQPMLFIPVHPTDPNPQYLLITPRNKPLSPQRLPQHLDITINQIRRRSDS